LVVIGLLLVPLAAAGVWTQRHVLDTRSFTELSVEVLHEPAVSDALARRLTNEVMARADLPASARTIVGSAVDAVLLTPQFEQVFRATVGTMHEQLERDDPQLVMDFNQALPVIRARVASIDATVAAQIPDDGLPVITVVREEEVPTLWQAVDIVRSASLVFPIAMLLVLAAAVAVSWHRAGLLIVIGAGLLVIALVLALLVTLGRGLLTDVVGPDAELAAFEAGYDAVTGSFVSQTAAFAVAGVAAGVAGAVLMGRQKRNRRPLSWA